MSIANKSLLPDEAIDNARKFGFEDYSTLLSKIIQDPNLKTPFTIAIHGDWGSGKTSLMKTISKKLELSTERELGVKIIWFNAWEFEKLPTPLWAVFLNRVIMDLQEMLSDSERKDKIKAAGKGLLLLTGNLALQRIIGITSKDIEEIKEKVWTDIKSINSLREELSKYVQQAIEEDLDKRKRIVIFIDDLDRCLPEQCLEMFESMKLFLNCPNCVFVVGVDKEQIKKVFDRKFDTKDAQKGHSYIEKFVQLEFDLPRKTPDEVKDFLLEHAPQQLQDNPKTIELISKFIEPNPRKIKRWLNSVFFLESLFRIKQEKQNSAEIDLSLASIWLFLKSFFPDFANIVENDPSKLNTAIKVASGSGSEEEKQKIGDFTIDRRLSEFLSLLKPNYFEDQLKDLMYLSKLTPVSQVSVLPKDIIQRISEMTEDEFSSELLKLSGEARSSLVEKLIDSLSQISDWSIYDQRTKEFDLLGFILERSTQESLKINVFRKIIDFMLKSKFAYRYFDERLSAYLADIGKEGVMKMHLIDKIITVFAKSTSFESAKTNSAILLDYVDVYTNKELALIVDGFLKNEQINSSFGAQKNLKRLFLQRADSLPKDKIKEINKSLDMQLDYTALQ